MVRDKISFKMLHNLSSIKNKMLVSTQKCTKNFIGNFIISDISVSVEFCFTIGYNPRRSYDGGHRGHIPTKFDNSDF